MNDENLSTKSIFGWKGIVLAIIVMLTLLFILYLAIGSDPDYMPSQQKKKQQAEQQMNMANDSHTEQTHNSNSH